MKNYFIQKAVCDLIVSLEETSVFIRSLSSVTIYVDGMGSKELDVK